MIQVNQSLPGSKLSTISKKLIVILQMENLNVTTNLATGQLIIGLLAQMSSTSVEVLYNSHGTTITELSPTFLSRVHTIVGCTSYKTQIKQPRLVMLLSQQHSGST